MNDLLIFFQNYGLPITLIALLGIAVLGTLKYCNIFSKLEEKYRHWTYIVISVAISIIGTVSYLAITKQLEFNYIISVSVALFALNQTFYNIFKVTSINQLGIRILDIIKVLWNKIKEVKNKNHEK